jgi:hypothetical protein
MAHNHGNKPNGDSSLSRQIMVGSMATAVVATGSKMMSNASRHPVIVFGLGMVAGYFAYKYRKEIIAQTTKSFDAGKDFILHQKENLEDLVAEAKDSNA